jgi:uncharacterized membrane protein
MLGSCTGLVAVVGPVVAAVVGVVALPVQARLQGRANRPSSTGNRHVRLAIHATLILLAETPWTC